MMKAFIFDEPGTGKTRRSIELLHDRKHVLVVCPANVIPSWRRQIRQWDQNKDSLTIKEYRKGGWNDDVKYLVVSYETLHHISDVPEFSVIFDESHYLKNPKSKRSLLSKNISAYAEDVLMLTGTPAPRNVEDVFGQSCVLYPDRSERMKELSEDWRTLGAFRRKYGVEKTMWVRGMAFRQYEYSDDSAEEITKLMSRHVLELRKGTYSPPSPIWIPVKEYNEIERRLIGEWKRNWSLNGTEASDATSVALKIGQLDDGFIYENDDRQFQLLTPTPSKLKTLMMLQYKLGKTLLVWSRYKIYPTILRSRYHMREVVDAKSYLHMSDDAKRHVKIVVANPASMGTGVDGLQHYLTKQVWFDLPWTYAEYKQGCARLIRRGSVNPDDWSVYLLDTPFQRRMWNVVSGRETLDEIIKEEC